MLSVAARMRALPEMLKGSLVFGLGHSIDEGGFVEVDDPAYMAQPIVLGAPEQDGEDVVAKNIAQVAFEPWAEDAPSEVRYWYIADADGVLVAADELKPTSDGTWVKPYAGWTYRFDPGEISVGLKP